MIIPNAKILSTFLSKFGLLLLLHLREKKQLLISVDCTSSESEDETESSQKQRSCYSIFVIYLDLRRHRSDEADGSWRKVEVTSCCSQLLLTQFCVLVSSYTNSLF